MVDSNGVYQAFGRAREPTEVSTTDCGIQTAFLESTLAFRQHLVDRQRYLVLSTLACLRWVASETAKREVVKVPAMIAATARRSAPLKVDHGCRCR